MHVGRFSFSGTWKGTGQRRAARGREPAAAGNQTILFTPAWGATTPNLAERGRRRARAVSRRRRSAPTWTRPCPRSAPAQVAIPADGAVLVATGADAAKLEAEAPPGTQVTVRLILPRVGSVVSARRRRAAARQGRQGRLHDGRELRPDRPRARGSRAPAVGQLADGRVILVAVDGGRPGYSVGMTSYELAKTMARLGAVTAAGARVRQATSPPRSTGEVAEPPERRRPGAGQGGAARPVPGRLRAAAVRGAARQGERGGRASSSPTASLAPVDRDRRRVVGARRRRRTSSTSGSRQPGTVPLHAGRASTPRARGTGRVSATDDQSRQSTADRTFSFDLTLYRRSTVPRSRDRRPGVKVGFTLSRPATRRCCDRDARERHRRRARSRAASLPAGRAVAQLGRLRRRGAKAPAGRVRRDA